MLVVIRSFLKVVVILPSIEVIMVVMCKITMGLKLEGHQGYLIVITPLQANLIHLITIKIRLTIKKLVLKR
jgi:hypothetical protein